MNDINEMGKVYVSIIIEDYNEMKLHKIFKWENLI